jgi:DNA ligase (NAD+)
VGICRDSQSVADYFAFMTQQRGTLPYEIDGVVYKIDSLADQKRLGHSSRAPRYAVAEKFPAHDAITTITDIDVQVGRTGVITPVAHVQGVLVGGVNVTRASMHNANEIQRKDVRIGDRVLIRRAGDVIPQIVRVMEDQRCATSTPFLFPTQCPSCQGSLSRKEGAVAWRCTAGSACPDQAIWRLRHYVSRDAMDIVGLGVRQLTVLYQAQLVRTPADLFRLKTPDLQHLDGWGEKSATQIVQAIADRRQTSLHRWIYALGIPCVGYITAKALADHYKNRDHWATSMDQACTPHSPAEQELRTISGVGQDILQEIIHFTQTQQDWVQDLSQFVTITAPEPESNHALESWPLYNKTVVFTGTLPNMTRAEARERAEQCGARVLSGLSQSTDFLVSGEKSGKKIDQARTWNITLLNYEEWMALLAQCQPRRGP